MVQFLNGDRRGEKLSFLRTAVGRRAAVAVEGAGASIDQPPPPAAPTFPPSCAFLFFSAPTFPPSCAFLFDESNLKWSDRKKMKINPITSQIAPPSLFFTRDHFPPSCAFPQLDLSWVEVRWWKNSATVLRIFWYRSTTSSFSSSTWFSSDEIRPATERRSFEDESNASTGHTSSYVLCFSVFEIYFYFRERERVNRRTLDKKGALYEKDFPPELLSPGSSMLLNQSKLKNITWAIVFTIRYWSFWF